LKKATANPNQSQSLAALPSYLNKNKLYSYENRLHHAVMKNQQQTQTANGQQQPHMDSTPMTPSTPSTNSMTLPTSDSNAATTQNNSSSSSSSRYSSQITLNQANSGDSGGVGGLGANVHLNEATSSQDLRVSLRKKPCMAAYGSKCHL
jgi:hypothetical protein